ncbi:MAG: hypothetical protein COS82_07515 [Zetaproteobacteria bacterium CG06_land_8_20_14_3_00_59_53]|nr:MAG: hypothetical protein AUK36_11105 [Zetaproteobacteria bacterium CG2_30_59_37]PIQ65728.1 MAG: hypothetical protein COV97_02475 [Zetaproteobacteria bacterium CG11_big_fil_rev_8_21_14_0_20_59_439]PIU70250.1 MAG: hypothetical protein COS82_07515 [Zetaproteobacteria bacterium CG06_land_8_20_14_3_00_59_53]PIY46120.1 MAG: hypothetical protein COZ02_06890 [Zetaproteobacteria bacterium CG_4_10_14_0_8_um_filter_59_127]PJC17783.1 MAG: hypothetical protein CO062_05870 [Zetaproteobacteria bacterium C
MTILERICLTLLLLISVTFSQPAAASNTSKTDTIREMGMHSEALVDALIIRDKKLAGQHYNLLKAELDGLHAMSAKLDFSERRTREQFTAYSCVRLISIDMQAGAWTGAAIAANQMSGETVRFTDFANLTLRDVAWMDYLGRDVMLLSIEDMQGNQQAIDLRRSELAEPWKRVREEMIKDFRNKTLVMRGDQLIERMQQAGKGEALIGLSKEAHTLVLDMQQVLANSPS